MIVSILLGLSLAANQGQAGPIPAFPGAEGFGAYAVGGRGGNVYIVDTLEDYHPGRGEMAAVTRNETGQVIRPAQPAVAPEEPIPGSLRACLNVEGPRTIVFAVAGTIELMAPLVVTEPCLTLAGQSAPGGGICLKNFGLSVSNTHDIIIRCIRARPGEKECLAFDAINIGGSKNVIIDHCSASWAVDETLSISSAGSDNVTVQWCFITESLHDSYHPKGPHGMGSLLRTNGNISFHHNLYAHHNARSPRPGTYGDGSILLDFRNNVVYNWRAVPGYSAEDPVRMNYVGNYLKPGPDSKKRTKAFYIGGESTVIYAEENLLVDGDKRIEGGWELIARGGKKNRAKQPFPKGQINTQAPEAAMADVLQHAGAVLPGRDAVDARIVAEFRESKGGIVNTPRDVGGWPRLQPGEPAPDSDHDGMPDAWESNQALDPKDAADGRLDQDGDGYTNLEEYLNSHFAEIMRP